ncbi:MAG: hypothetical protein M3464_02880 [Chloroflexota bacterium]|nr:hypothetical protein [Chloroflexota bacterium]
MDEYQDQTTNGQVIVGAGVAAVLLAGLALLLGRRWQAEDTAAERVRHEAEAAIGEARTRGRWLRDRAKEASPELERAAKEARHLVERGSRSGDELAHDVEEHAKRLASRTRRTGEQTASTAQQVAAQAAAAVERAERALGAGASLAEAARERAPRVAHRLGDEVVPSLREVAAHAAEAALDLWHEARERAAAIDPVDLRHLEKQAMHLAAAGGDLARDTGTAVADRASDLSRRVAETTELTVDRARDASKKTAGGAAELAKDASKRTAETGKNTGALLFWMGAAAGLIFYALLNQERRAQVSEQVAALSSQVQTLIKDFQGYDEEF